MTTEAELYARVKPHLNRYGLCSRIENSIGSGMPDVLYASGGSLILIENKIMHSSKIHLRPYQWAFAVMHMHHLAPHFLWYLVDNNNALELYMFSTIKFGVMPTMSENKVTINMTTIKPDFILKTPSSVKEWLLEIDEMDLNFDYSGSY